MKFSHARLRFSIRGSAKRRRARADAAVRQLGFASHRPERPLADHRTDSARHELVVSTILVDKPKFILLTESRITRVAYP